MRVDVVLLPALLFDFDRARSLCIVVDVLRASSTIITLLAGGAKEVLPVASIEAARRLKGRWPDYLLCGEEGGLPPTGFDYGNSPSELARAPVAGRSVILATSNGTRVLSQVAPRPSPAGQAGQTAGILVGALLNRSAVAEAALALGERQGVDLSLVCAGAHEGTRFALEDALGAGAIVEAVLAQEPSLSLSDAAFFARTVFLAAKYDLHAVIAAASHARDLQTIGLSQDVEYCAQVDVSPVVPHLTRGDEGTLSLVPFS